MTAPGAGFSVVCLLVAGSDIVREMGRESERDGVVGKGEGPLIYCLLEL